MSDCFGCSAVSSYCILTIYYSSKSDATYVVNFDEYEGLVTKIGKRPSFRPIIVFVEMPEVEKVFSKVSKANLSLH